MPTNGFPGAELTKTWLRNIERPYLQISCGEWSYGKPDIRLAGSDLPRRLVIGRYCSIGREAVFFIGRHGRHPVTSLTTYPMAMAVSHSLLTDSPPPSLEQICDKQQLDLIIGDDVWIGVRATIMAGVTIGTGAIIAAGAVVTRDVAPYSVVAGVPAKEIKKRFDDSTVSRIQKTRWWEKEPDEIWALLGKDSVACEIGSVLGRLEKPVEAAPNV